MAALATIGLSFLLLTGWFAGVPVVLAVWRGRDLETETVLRSLGLGAAIVWFLIGFAVVSWLVALPFVGAAYLLDAASKLVSGRWFFPGVVALFFVLLIFVPPVARARSSGRKP